MGPVIVVDFPSIISMVEGEEIVGCFSAKIREEPNRVEPLRWVENVVAQMIHGRGLD